MRDFANSLALSHKKECGIKGKLRPPWRRGGEAGDRVARRDTTNTGGL